MRFLPFLKVCCAERRIGRTKLPAIMSKIVSTQIVNNRFYTNS